MARIAFDLDGTIVGFRGERPVMRRGLLKVVRNLRRQGHTLILWTFGNRAWWREAQSIFPELRGQFHEVYTRDDLPRQTTRGRGYSEHVKDIRRINADVLVDNDSAHHEWAKRHGLARQYVLVETLGEG